MIIHLCLCLLTLHVNAISSRIIKPKIDCGSHPFWSIVNSKINNKGKLKVQSSKLNQIIIN